jgi:hypothetical protein
MLSRYLGCLVLGTDHLPTLWDPEELFSHLALWAGAPAIAVVIVVWLLGLYSSAKGWLVFGKSAVKVTKPRSTGQLGCFRACQRERCPLTWENGSC